MVTLEDKKCHNFRNEKVKINELSEEPKSRIWSWYSAYGNGKPTDSFTNWATKSHSFAKSSV